MMATRKLILILLISAFPALSQASDAHPPSKESESPEVASLPLLLGTIILTTYMESYYFLWGVTLGGNALTQGVSPKMATNVWAGFSLTGMALSWVVSGAITQDYRDRLGSGPGSGKPGALRFYRVLFAGASTASILDFRAESTFDEADGQPQWKASTPEVKTATTFPAIGHRLGFSGRRWGGEFEISVVSHHTIKQTVSYDAEGVIYGNIPIQLDTVEIPDRFLMLHSLSMGANFYVWLPRVGVRPYVGLGGRLLLNSVQSQYPGPADLTLQTGKLALDSMNRGWGFHALVGFRAPLSSETFLYVEYRPARHYFGYKSGSGQLRERDRFTLQIFEIQLGLGFFFS